MPCYTRWDSYLERGSATYIHKRKELEAKFFSLTHLIDYYFRIFGKSPSKALHEGGMSYRITTDSDPLTDDEYDAICRHLVCDGVHQDEIYDVESLLNTENDESCRYAYVLIQCATRLRINGNKYHADESADPAVSLPSAEPSWFTDKPH